MLILVGVFYYTPTSFRVELCKVKIYSTAIPSVLPILLKAKELIMSLKGKTRIMV